ncbi:MAG: dihydrolipoamide acetyltransferase family protein [Sphaerochaetaceae bacterium]|nr:dihydrolipoamide acetyltransferase family protein [Sphaerochaetaceae bacterium]
MKKQTSKEIVGMASQVVMPKQGNSVESCIIVEWKKKVGDSVAVGDVLCAAETDKSTIDVESTAAGTVLALLYEEGADVPVMLPIAVVGELGEKFEGTGSPAPVSTDVQTSSVVEVPVVDTPAGMPASASMSVGAVETTGASPRARNLAGSLGVPLSALSATGPKGRIIERDVVGAVGQPLTPAAKAAALASGQLPPVAGSGIGGRVLSSDVAVVPAGADAAVSEPAAAIVAADGAGFPGAVTEIPVRGVRKVTARRMMESIHGTCQLTLHSFADASALKRLRAGFKASDPGLGLTKITINDLVLFAVARTLVQFPEFNAHFLGDRILRFDQVHLGMATDTPRGLLVPVIRDAARLSLADLSAAAKKLAVSCMEGTVAPDDLTGSTFTVSNVGSFGIEAFTPVLNVPEVAILGVGGISLKPVEGKDGSVAFVPHIGLSLTIDHQAVDGAPGARFLQALSANIAAIDLLLAK